MTACKEYGPIQLATFLGLGQWQLDQALEAGLIPGPDTARGRWSAAVGGAALARIGEIRAVAGGVPDLCAVRAAELLTGRLGVTVTGHGVAELACRGLLPVAGQYKGWPLYDGRILEAFTDAAEAAEATRAGRLRTAAESAAYLRIRRSDLNHLIGCRVLRPVRHGRGPWDRRGTCCVPLYRTGDLDDLLARPDIDWPAVRSTPPRAPFSARRPGPRRNRARHPGRPASHRRRPAMSAPRAAALPRHGKKGPGQCP